MTIQQTIERAVAGGYEPRSPEGRHEKPVVKVEYLEHSETVEFWFRYEFGGGDLTRQALGTILLDPTFWRALGKTMGWYDEDDFANDRMTTAQWRDGNWKAHWHHMIDHLAEGKDITTYFESL